MSNTRNKPTPHPHAELIKAWADGAKIQYWHENRHEWIDKGDPLWYEWCEYRIKPEESNAPWKPKDGEIFYIVNDMGNALECAWMDGCAYHNACYAHGNCFRTEKEAEAAAERIKAALKGKSSVVELDGTPLTIIEKEAIRKFRAGVPFPEAESGTWRALSPGEDALIRALRAVIIIEVHPWDNSVLVCKYGNGELMHTSQVIAFSLYAPSSSTKKAMDEINTALACIADERHKGGIQ